MAEYILFLSITALTSASPGPAVFLAIRNGVAYGLRKACAGVIGNFSAMILMAVSSALGLSAIILASSSLFMAIKLLGGCYLIYLGLKTWFAKTPTASHNNIETKLVQNQRGSFSIFKEAFWVGMSNPKAIVFFTALFPQFIDPSQDFLGEFLLLLVGFSFFSLFFLTLYAAIASQLHIQLKNTAMVRWLNKVTGAIFVGFGGAIFAFNK